jgi:ESS family glutamate:Na+ symporter
MHWNLVVVFLILSISLLTATLLRSHIRFLQRYLVPNAITAGFVGLGIMYFMERFFIVYHLLAVTFIAIGLKKRDRYIERNSLSTAFILTLGYAVEGFIGYTITLVFLFTLLPGIFPTFGMLFEIGFGQSSGQAYALGKQWEALGFVNGGTVGLTFGAIGFLWACFVGIPFLNWGVKKGYVKNVDKGMFENRGFFSRSIPGPVTSRATSHPDVIASGSLHVAMIGFIYLIDYFFIKLVVFLLGLSGSDFTMQLGKILWAYHAFFATLFAMLVGRILDRMDLHHILDDGRLTGIAASSVDFLITAAIMAIEIVVVVQYILPIAVICVIGGVATMAAVVVLARRSFSDHYFERLVSIFGLLTGTVSTGLALLRIIDPDYKTPAAGDLVLGSGFSLFLGFPLLFLINIPALYQNTKMYLITDAAILVYMIIILMVMISLKLLRKKMKGRSI